MSSAAALGIDLKEWPPYISNLVFELWELPEDSQTASAVGGAGAESAGDGASGSGRHVVRVLYNKQNVPLQHCKPGKCLVRYLLRCSYVVTMTA